MPWELELPDGTVVGDIPDDVTPQAAAEKLARKYPELKKSYPETGVFSKEFLPATGVGLKEGLYQAGVAGARELDRGTGTPTMPSGLVSGAKTVVGKLGEALQDIGLIDKPAPTPLTPEEQRKEQAARELIMESRQRVADASPINPSGAFTGVSSGVQNLGRNAPFIAAAVATRNPAYAAIPAGLEYLNPVAEGIVQGVDAEKRSEAGLRGASLEFFNVVPAGSLIKNLGTDTFVKAGLKYLGYTYATEIPQEFLQQVNEDLSLHPELSGAEVLKKALATVPQTVISATISGPGSLVIGAGVNSAMNGGTKTAPKLEDVPYTPPSPTQESYGQGGVPTIPTVPIEDVVMTRMKGAHPALFEGQELSPGIMPDYSGEQSQASPAVAFTEWATLQQKPRFQWTLEDKVHERTLYEQLGGDVILKPEAQTIQVLSKVQSGEMLTEPELVVAEVYRTRQGEAQTKSAENGVDGAFEDFGIGKVGPEFKQHALRDLYSRPVVIGQGDGGFNTLRPGQVIVQGETTSSRFDQKRVDVAQRLVESWAKIYTPDTSFRLMVSPFGNATEASLGAAARLEDGSMAMLLPPTKLNDATYYNTVSHEFSHHLMESEFSKADTQTKQQLVDVWTQKLVEAQEQTWKQFAQGWYSKGSYEYIAKKVKSLGLDVNAPAKDVIAQLEGMAKRRGYFGSFNEFFAEQGSRYLHGQRFHMESDSFFANVVAKLERFFNQFGKRWSAEKDFATWMDNLAKGRLEDVADAPAALENQRNIVKELKKRGVSKEILATLDDPINGFDNDLAQALLQETDLSGVEKRGATPEEQQQLDLQETIRRSELSTRVLEMLPTKKAFVPRSTVESLMRQQSVRQEERDVLEKVLARYPESLIPTEAFKAAVEAELLPLRAYTSAQYARHGIDRIWGDVDPGNATTVLYATDLGKYPNVALGDHWGGLHTYGWVREYDSPNTPILYLTEIQTDMERYAAADKAWAKGASVKYWYERLIRESVKRAANEGKEYVRIPTENTAAAIQGWAEGHDFDNLKKLYAETLPKFVKKTYGGTYVNDSIGNEWLEFKVPPSAASEPTLAFFGAGLENVVDELTLGGGSTIPQDSVRFNGILKNWAGLFEIGKVNSHVPGVTDYVQAARNKMMYKNRSLRVTEATASSFVNELSKEESGHLSQLLFAEDDLGSYFSQRFDDPNNPGHYIFKLDAAKKAQFKVSDKAEELYSAVRNNLYRALKQMEGEAYGQVAVNLAADRRLFQNNNMRNLLRDTMKSLREQQAQPTDIRTALEGALQAHPTAFTEFQQYADKIEKEFTALGNKAYVPHTRFGKYAVTVKATQDLNYNGRLYKAGQTLMFETVETSLEQRELHAETVKAFGNAKVAVTPSILTDEEVAFAGLPPTFVDSLQQNLALTPQQMAKLRETVISMSPANSFAKRMKRRQNIAGYSEDFIRAYADYFLRYANHISKVQAGPEFDAALQQMEDFKKDMLVTPGSNANNLSELLAWFKRHKDYMWRPAGEWYDLKAFTTLWYLGGSIPTTVTNMTQVPFVTLPYLSKHYGNGEALRALTMAYKDATRGWADPNVLLPDEQAMMNAALDAGFVNESFATETAQLREGSTLTKLQPVTAARAVLNKINHYALLPFSKVEELNRRVTTLAAYRLARQKRFSGDFDEAAYLSARQAVEDTQNEYAIENRPEMMRGKKSVVFQFMQYSTHMTFMMFGGDASWKRLLLAQLLIGGLMGLPFANDLKELAKWLARQFGADFDAERHARELLADLEVNPDLIMRGFTTQTGPFDMSDRYSLGRMVPGMEAIGSNKPFQDAFVAAAGDAGGAGFSLITNMAQAVGNTKEPDSWKRWRKIMPTSLRYVGDAVAADGDLKTPSGAVIGEMSTAQMLGYPLGFQPQEKVAEQRIGSIAQESANFWITRRTAVLNQLKHVYAGGQASPDAMDAAMKAMRTYNAEVPSPKLRITADSLRNAVKQQAQAQALERLGGGGSQQTYDLKRKIRDEITVDQPEEEEGGLF